MPMLASDFEKKKDQILKKVHLEPHQTEWIEKRLFLLTVMQKLISKPRPDLLRFNLNLNDFNHLIKRVDDVNLRDSSTKESFESYCENVRKKIKKKHSKTGSLHPDYFFGMVPFYVFSQTGFFEQVKNCPKAGLSDLFHGSSLNLALAKKAFLMELANPAMHLYKNYRKTKRYLELNNIFGQPLCLLKYRQIAQNLLPVESFELLSPLLETHEEIEHQLHSAYLNYMGLLTELGFVHIPQQIHALLYFYKNKCFDVDRTMKSVIYMVDYMLKALDLEGTMVFESDVKDDFGTHELSLSKSFFAFFFASLLKKDMFLSLDYNMHTSEYCFYKVDAYESEVLKLYQPTFTIHYDAPKSRQQKSMKKTKSSLDLNDLIANVTISSDNLATSSDQKRTALALKK